MFSLFETDKRNRGRTINANWSYVKRTLTSELNKILYNYHYIRHDSVMGTHLLERLITTLNLPPTEDHYSYMDNAIDNLPGVARAMNLSHATNAGKLHRGEFYNNSSREIIFLHESNFDIESGVKGWRDLRPVEVVEHSFSDMSWMPPSSDYGVNKDAIAVIMINGPMLALQYREWLNRESIQLDETAFPIRTFIGKYVLPNMLPSHMDLVIWNRFVNKCLGLPNDSNNQRQSIPVMDFTRRLDELYLLEANNIIRHRYPLNEIPGYFPLVTRDTLRDYLVFDDLSDTRYTLWIMGLIRLRKLMFLIEFFEQYDQLDKYQWFNPLLRDLLRLTSDNVFRQYLPANQYREVMDKIRDMAKAVGIRM